MLVVIPKDHNSLNTGTGTVVALGNFDGLHCGHMELINRVIRVSQSSNYRSMVYTFMNHPENVMAGRIITPLITTNEAKIKILKNSELDYLVFEEFSEEIMKMLPEDFVRNILVGKFNVKYAAVGFNYRFGYRGQGNNEMLKTLGNKYGFKVDVIEPVSIDNTVISSSIIRKYIIDGQVDRATLFLGRYYSITGEIVEGRKMGNKIGFPTINIIPSDEIVIPAKGVYMTTTKVKGKTYYSLTNVGKNPTVGGNDIRIETHILDFKGDLYGYEAEISFLKKIRDEKKFNNVNELAQQIEKDVTYARASEKYSEFRSQ